MIPLVAELLDQARQLSQSGNLSLSVDKYQQILSLEPEIPLIHFELGAALFNQGRRKSAIKYLQQAIELDPNQPAFHNSLGIAYSGDGNLSAGASCFERALELAPGFSSAQFNLGSNYKDQGRLTDAADCYRKAISTDPKYIKAYIFLSGLLRQQRQLSAAADVYQKALAAGTRDAEILFNLAVTLLQMGQASDAASIFKSVTTDHPEISGVHNDLAKAQVDLGRFDEAIASFKKAAGNEPGSAKDFYSLSQVLLDHNDLSGAITSLRDTLAIEPDHVRAHSNLLLIMNYFPNVSQEEIYREALQFDLQQATGTLKSRAPISNSREENRRLRIGYISPDFRKHSVALFTRQLIAVHDRNKVEVFCYANINAANQDEVTSEFRDHADHWVPIFEMDDREVADRIEHDQIDILVDLAGHTAHSRLLVFTRKPAPILVNWLGYPNTTGLNCIDYRLTDEIADPQNVNDRWYTEKLIRLPHGFLCFQPDEMTPETCACPHLKQGHITYGSFNLALKITPDVVRIWSRILTMTPDSRLILKSSMLGHEKTKAEFLQQFTNYGIAPERLDLLGFIAGKNAHLAAYSSIDIGLDPFPYNGTATTCEALWMGVPVISLLGDRHSGRVGASILNHAGLPEMLADNEDAYVEKACSLAIDRQRLVTLREELRSKMRTSNLMDTKQFTHSLENVYKDIWKNWCSQHN